MSLSSIAHHVTGIVRGDAPGKGRSDGVRPDAENAGTSHADRMFRIRSVCAEMGLLTVATKAPDGRTYMETILDDERPGDIVAPEGATIEEYALRPLVTRNLEKYLALGPQLAYKLNVPSVKVERRGDTVWVQVPADAKDIPEVVTFAQAWALAPDFQPHHVLLGVSAKGKQLTLDLDANWHVGVFGQSNSGKSTLLRTIGLSCLHTRAYRLALLDPSGGFAPLSGHPDAIWQRGHFSRLDDVRVCLRYLARQVANNVDLRDAGRELVVLLDESKRVTEDPAALDALAALLETGRHSGLHVVMGAQAPTGFSTRISNNWAAVLVGRMGTAQAAGIAGAREAALIRKRGAFEGRSTLSDHFSFQAAWPELEPWAERFPPRRGVLPATPKPVSVATPTPLAAPHQAATVAAMQSTAPVIVEGTPYRGDTLPASVRSKIVRYWMRQGEPPTRRDVAGWIGCKDMDADKWARWRAEALGVHA